MEPLYHAISLASAGAVSILIGAIWQGAVLVAGVCLCLRMLPRLSAASRSLVWLNVFLLLVLLHVLPALRVQPGVTEAGRSWQIDLDSRWSLAIAAVWAVLSLWNAVQLISGAVHLHRLAGRATPLPGSVGLEELLQIGPRGRAVELCLSDEVARPSVFGFFRPRILLPPALAERLSELELRQVVMHEMEHLRRADDWTNLIQKVALVLFPLNPVLHWVERRVCTERELACDDRVLLSSGARRAYAICLTRLAEYSMLRRGLSLVLGAWERRPELVRRVHRLLARPNRGMGSWQAKFVTASLTVGVLGGALALARSPQFVGFATPAAVRGSEASTPLPARAAALALTRQSLQHDIAPARMVNAKAILPQRPAHKRSAARNARGRMLAGNAVQGNGSSEQPGWLVLTEWNANAAQPRAVFALKLSPRGSYAAVPTMNGWLIVQI